MNKILDDVMFSKYNSLNSKTHSKYLLSLRVCIVTPDLLGPVKNGGIGTACTYLAENLARYGHKVHILLTQGGYNYKKDSTKWIERYTKQNIEVTQVFKWEDENCEQKPYFPESHPLNTSYTVYSWLQKQSGFDCILFMEWLGNGYYALEAKKCGLFFEKTALGVITHSPSLWHNLTNATASRHPLESIIWHIERRSVELADFVISPSAYMLDWCKAHDFNLPSKIFVQPNILELKEDFKSVSEADIDEIVFFGRLEWRKGLAQFCSALDILAKQKRLPPKVTFMGKPSWVQGLHSLQFLGNRAKAWNGCKISFRLHYDHYQAMEYLCQPGRLAVMPSVADNSPYTVYECLLAGIPFLARNVGGIPELVADSFHDRVLFGDNPRDLANKIISVLGKPPLRASLACNLEDVIAGWQRGLPALVQEVNVSIKFVNPPAKKESNKPFISVCLTHFNRPWYLRQAVESLINQTYKNFEVILVDDGSTDPDALKYLDELEPQFRKFGWKILRLENGFLGRARNMAVKEASADWLLFFDDDNIATTQMLKCCAQTAANCTAAGATIMFNVFKGILAPDDKNWTARYLPCGDIVSFAPIDNALGDATALINKHVFNKLGGFTEDYGVGNEDFELFIHILLSGEKLLVIPEPLYWYRRIANAQSMLAYTDVQANAMRSIRPFMEILPAPLAEMAFMTHGMIGSAGPGQQGELVRDDGYFLPDIVNSDPAADETMVDVLQLLESENEISLAPQVLDSMLAGSSGDNSANARLKLRARKAACLNNASLLLRYVNKFEHQNPSDLERARFYSGVLANLPRSEFSLRSIFIERLAGTNVNSMFCHLIIARHAALARLDELAIQYYFKALAIAEEKYQWLRPDVREAIAAGSLQSALEHWFLYGFTEGATWYGQKYFQRALLNMRHLKERLASQFCQAYGLSDLKLAEKIVCAPAMINTMHLLPAAEEAIERGDFLLLQEHIRKFQKSEIPDMDTDIFYATIAEKMLAKELPLTEELLRLMDTQKNNIPQLGMAYVLQAARVHDYSKAAQYFIKILEQAEKEYLKKRSDVKKAINNGEFICALHHYAFCGRKENMTWPNLKNYKRMLTELSGLAGAMAAIQKEHMKKWQYDEPLLANALFSSLQNQFAYANVVRIKKAASKVLARLPIKVRNHQATHKQ